MSESADGLSEAAWEQVYSLYGRVMHDVQWFELSIRGLAAAVQPDEPEPALDDAVERLFRRPLAKLARQARADPTLADDIQAAVRTRNTLAHEFLLLTELRAKADAFPLEDAIERLEYAQARYADLRARLDELQSGIEAELGIDIDSGLSDEEVAQMIREVDAES